MEIGYRLSPLPLVSSLKRIQKDKLLLCIGDEAACKAALSLHQHLCWSLSRGITCPCSYQILQPTLLPQASSRPVLFCTTYLLLHVPKAPVPYLAADTHTPLPPYGSVGSGVLCCRGPFFGVVAHRLSHQCQNQHRSLGCLELQLITSAVDVVNQL